MPAKRKPVAPRPRQPTEKRNKLTPAHDDKGNIRLSSPGFGSRKNESTEFTTKDIREKYVLNAGFVMKCMAPEGTTVDEESKEYKDACTLDYSAWWPTNSIILPTNFHFPPSNSEDAEESPEGTAGLIRPVSETQVTAIEKAFDEFGGTFNPEFPVHLVLLLINEFGFNNEGVNQSFSHRWWSCLTLRTTRRPSKSTRKTGCSSGAECSLLTMTSTPSRCWFAMEPIGGK
jgi:hypothetical protein